VHGSRGYDRLSAPSLNNLQRRPLIRVETPLLAANDTAMRFSRAPTSRLQALPVVVVVGAPKKVVTVCESCAATVSARVEACALDSAATTVAQYRPFALLVPDFLYDFDPREFDALCRDVDASLIVLRSDLPLHRIRGELLPSLMDAARHREQLAARSHGRVG
jgi:hypothetical protein